MLSMSSQKTGSWQTVKSKTDEKKKRQEEKAKKDVKKDRLGVTVDPQAAAFAAFDRHFAAKAAAAVHHEDQNAKGYKGAFAGLVDEAPPAALQEAGDEGSSGDEASAVAGAPAAAPKQPKQPKVKKPKLSVSQVAAGVDVSGLQFWMAEVQQRYSTNETAQLEALSDRLLVAFKEATLDLAKILATKGLDVASAQPLCEVPNPLMNALASFVASVSEEALARMVVPLTAAVITDAAGGASGTAPAGKGKAGLQIMLAVILRTRPQVLVQAAADLRHAGRQLSGTGRLPLLLWVINQAGVVDPAVGVAAWVRLLLPQLLGLPELPSSSAGAAAAGKGGKGGSSITPAGLADDLLRPLELPLQGPAIEYLSGLLGKAAAAGGGDVTRGDGEVEATVPGSAVELLSRLLAGKAWAPPAAAGTAGGAAAAAAESKKAATARAAAAAALAPMLPGLTALAASTSSQSQYSEWLLLALESAGQSSADPESPDELVERSASNVVACLCGSDACFALWESKHKGSLRGSARVLAAMVQHPQLLRPLQQQPSGVEAFRKLLAALPARHRTHLATGKGWQGTCARVAEDACNKLPKKLGRGWKGSKGAASSSSAGGAVFTVLGASMALAGVVVMAGLYRHEVAGIVQAYAGKETAEQLDAKVLVPLEAVLQQAAPYVQQLQTALEPTVSQVQAASAPLLASAWEVVGPAAKQVQEQVLAPALTGLEQLVSYTQQQLQDIVAQAKSQ